MDFICFPMALEGVCWHNLYFHGGLTCFYRPKSRSKTAGLTIESLPPRQTTQMQELNYFPPRSYKSFFPWYLVHIPIDLTGIPMCYPRAAHLGQVSIADPRREDCPLIAVSDEFLTMTGYLREEVVGAAPRGRRLALRIFGIDLQLWPEIPVISQ